MPIKQKTTNVANLTSKPKSYACTCVGLGSMLAKNDVGQKASPKDIIRKELDQQ